MTERKPPGVDFETWVERQIREAMERGEFDNLSGAGKPLPAESYDELWWVKQTLRRENVSYLPPTLALRKEAEDARCGGAGFIRGEGEADHRRHQREDQRGQPEGDVGPITQSGAFRCRTGGPGVARAAPG